MKLKNGTDGNDRQVRNTYRILLTMTQAERLEALGVARGAKPTQLMEEKGLAFEGRIPGAARNAILSAVRPGGTLQEPWE